MPNQGISLSTLSKREFPFIHKVTREQEEAVEKLYRKNRLILEAKAGTGKTTIMTQAMVAAYKKGLISRVEYVISPVQEKAIGYRPGDTPEKIVEYAIPFTYSLSHYPDLGMNDIRAIDVCNMDVEGDFKVVPHTFLRGQTKENVGIIIDEAQNYTTEELQKVLTRISDNCLVAIIGHTGQTDIKGSGFSKYIAHFKQGVQSGEFTGIDFAELTINHRGEFSNFADEINKFMTFEGGKVNEKVMGA
jgi:phosphate starvation-inducible protein PhoH